MTNKRVFICFAVLKKESVRSKHRIMVRALVTVLRDTKVMHHVTDIRFKSSR
ncbi:uncharacterized protein PHALS_02881 [Plasmopara halstedii]|uniref:Uncharacterized protein n=1 Tax=Plasmopara halstedii TaxID=4781 RepID=A0A0P1AVR8_PLAHL|nr:uncharacterized protein PHALS_02881 [Plasmopara halstedii]CEG46481.1 hypothetical protein PHALS_02881 [Plasmopara halstedii]|eukprot:XP_024582850.1 hypothetical protein PHALS_02881 [Plasmopara halstedii]